MFNKFFETLNHERPPTAPPIEAYIQKIIRGDCTQVMSHMPSASVDFILTDPPYLVNYTSRDRRSFSHDDPNNAQWLKPAYAEAYRLLKPNRYMVSFYGYTQAEKFIIAWKSAGFRIVEHFVWIKGYASSTGKVKRHHEMAYLLAKGTAPAPRECLVDVLQWQYSGNKLHPSQKPETALIPLIKAFSKLNDIVLDPFAGSGTTLAVAKLLGRLYIGIELDSDYAHKAEERLKE